MNKIYKIMLTIGMLLIMTCSVFGATTVITDTNSSFGENISASYFIGDGSQLTGISAGNAWSDAVDSSIIPDTNYAYDLGSAALSFKNAYIDDVADIETVQTANIWYSTSSSHGQVLLSTDYVYLKTGGSAAAWFKNDAITINPNNGNRDFIVDGDTSEAVFTVDAGTEDVSVLNNLSVGGNVSASYFIGDGSQLTNLAAGGDAWSDAVDSDIIPDTDGTYDIGNTSHSMKMSYLDDITVTNRIWHKDDSDTYLRFLSDRVQLYSGGGFNMDFQTTFTEFNPSEVAKDFIINGDDPNLIYADGTNNKVGIGTSTPGEKLEVNGNINVTTGNDICIEGGNCLSTAGGDAWSDAVDSDIIPDTDLTYDLGNSSNRYTEIHGSSVYNNYNYVGAEIRGDGDTDTAILLNTDDKITLKTGGVQAFSITEDASQDKIEIGYGSGLYDVDFIVHGSTNDDVFVVDAGTEEIKVGGDFLPKTNDAYALGSTSAQFTSLFLDNNIQFSNSGNVLFDTDLNTYFGGQSDQLNMVAGGIQFADLKEDDTQDMFRVNTVNADIDFIVEGDTNDNVLVVDASEEDVEILNNIDYQETDGNVSTYSNGCYQKVNTTGVYTIC